VIRCDTYAVTAGLPGEHAFARVDLRTQAVRGDDVRHDAPLGKEKASVGLQDPSEGRWQMVAGEATINIRGVQHLMWQIMEFAR